MKIDIITDNTLIIPEYIMILKINQKKTMELAEYREKLKNLDLQKNADKIIEPKDKKNLKRKKFKKKFYKN